MLYAEYGANGAPAKGICQVFDAVFDIIQVGRWLSMVMAEARRARVL